MIFEILSKKRNLLLLTTRIAILVIMILSFYIIIEYDSLYAKIVLGIVLLYNITPLCLLGKKCIGKLEFCDSEINFITQEGKIIELKFCDIFECKFEYYGYKGALELFYVGLYWNHGENKLKIKAISGNYEILFLSTALEDKNKLIQYTEKLKNNNIRAYFEFAKSYFGQL